MAKLNNEKTSEILKAAAFGHSAEVIADYFDVDAKTIEKLIDDSSKEIASIKKYYGASKLGDVKE